LITEEPDNPELLHTIILKQEKEVNELKFEIEVRDRVIEMDNELIDDLEKCISEMKGSVNKAVKTRYWKHFLSALFYGLLIGSLVTALIK